MTAPDPHRHLPLESGSLRAFGLHQESEHATGLRLWVRDGSGSQAVVLVHGIGLASETWLPLLSSLRADLPVLAVDLPGHGGSLPAPATWGLADTADAIATAVARRQSGVLLAGISMGAMVSQHLAVRHPGLVNGLVLGDCLVEQGPERREGLLARARQAREQGMEELVEPAIERWFSPEFRQSDPELVDRVRDVMRSADPDVHAWASWALSAHGLPRELARLTVPTFVLCGELDVSTPPELTRQVATAIPKSRYESIPGVGHLSAVEAPQRWARAITSVLRHIET